MYDRVVTRDLFWDTALTAALEEDQRWILAAMQKHGRQLVMMLWRILGDREDVCDAYQSTFLKLAHYECRQKPRNVKAYVFRAAANTAVSILRQKVTERKKLAEVRCRRSNCSSGEFDAQYLGDTLRYYVTRLPRQLRDVVALRDLAELPYRQVGAMLGISPATARVYRCKAVRLLAAWMDTED